MPGVRGGNGIDGANNGGKDHRGNSEALTDNITREKPYISSMDHPVPMKPQWRHIVVDWMLEVCEDQEVGAEVFLLAVHYLDTFVSSTLIRKSQFQLAATTCLLIASKMLRSVTCIGRSKVPTRHYLNTVNTNGMKILAVTRM